MTRIPIPHQREQIIDQNGIISRTWYRFFNALFVEIEKKIQVLNDNRNPIYLSDNARVREENKIIYLEIKDGGTWKEATRYTV